MLRTVTGPTEFSEVRAILDGCLQRPLLHRLSGIGGLRQRQRADRNEAKQAAHRHQRPARQVQRIVGLPVVKRHAPPRIVPGTRTESFENDRV